MALTHKFAKAQYDADEAKKQAAKNSIKNTSTGDLTLPTMKILVKQICDVLNLKYKP